jgi:molybdopterin-containing oxidoreductase family iron-sulfur binding subunit
MHMAQDKSRRDFLKKALIVPGILAMASPLAFLAKHSAQAASDPASTTPTTKRAWSMIIDLRKCDGCVSQGTAPQCTDACIQGHYVPKGQEWIQVFKQEITGGSYFQPTPCFQCENAPCVNVCPVGATFHIPSGNVIIDNHRCIGCRLCMAACPYQRRFFNWGQPQIPAEAFQLPHDPIRESELKGTVSKCGFCKELTSIGRLPDCVNACPQHALYMADLNSDVATNTREVVQASSFIGENNGYRYKEDLGTQPRVYYLPGHGEQAGRRADDKRELMPTTWPWEGFVQTPGVHRNEAPWYPKD